MQKKQMKKRILLCAVIAAAIALLAFSLDSRLAVRRYAVEAAEIDAPIRIALVTDLHSCRYGKDQAELIGAVRDENPDLVLLGGDIFDDVIGDANAEAFIAGMAGEFPLYYASGNHEYWSGEEAFAAKMDILEKYGVTILSGQCETLEIHGETINICGVDDPDAFLPDESGDDRESAFLRRLDAAAGAAPKEGYTLLLSHRPEYFEEYCARGFDLALCGHAHGGQWRLPGLLNGLYAPNQGLFPEYAGGRYDSDGATMIVSRGLARESTRIPRIFNRPELVMVELR